MKKCLALILACLMALPPVLSLAEEMTKEEAYTEYVELLDLYMLADEESPVDIQKLIEGFEGLRTYKYSIQFLIYARIMDFLAREDYQQAGVWLDVLMLYPDFADMLEAEDYPYSSIRAPEEMRLYYEGRVAQAQGDMTVAAEKYQHCLSFYDSMTRFMALGASLDGMFAQTLQLLADGDYEQVLANTEFLLSYGYTQAQPIHDMAKAQLEVQPTMAVETPRPQAQVKNMQLKGFYNGTSAAMSWDAVPGADGYRLYRSRGRQGEMVLIAEQQKAGYYDRNCYVGIYNGYIVEALQGDVVIARSQQTDVYCVAEKKTQAATAAPTAEPPTPTQAPVTQPPAVATPTIGGDDDFDWGFTIGDQGDSDTGGEADFTIGGDGEIDWDFEYDDGSGSDDGWTI